MQFSINKNAIWLLVIACFAVNCSKGQENDLGPVADNYVRYYIKPVDLFVGFVSDEKLPNTAPVGYSDFSLNIMCFPMGAGEYNGQTFSSQDVEKYRTDHFIHRTPKSNEWVEYDDPYNPEFNRIYDSLCTAHNDTKYSAARERYVGEQFAFPTLFRRMTLSVASDTDYDATHPAGTPLDDVLNVYFYSVKEIVESGYDFDKYPSKGFIDGHAIQEPLTQFNNEYRKLMGAMFKLSFTKAPAATSVHRFTVTYTDEDGRVLTSQMAPVTIQAGK